MDFCVTLSSQQPLLKLDAGQSQLGALGSRRKPQSGFRRLERRVMPFKQYYQ